jgi:predicted outer membrane repeat protein
MRSRLVSLVSSLALVFGLSVGAPAPVRAVDPMTYFIGHEDEILTYADGSDCASTTYWTDGEVAYNSDDDIVQDVAELAADGDTIHLCAGVWEFDAVVNTAIADVSIVGDGTDATIVDGGAVYNADGERTSAGTMLFAASIIPLLADMTIQHGGDGAVEPGAVVAQEVSIERVHFYRNEAEEVGGALTVDSASIHDSSFLENYAGEYGGAVYADGDVTLNQSTFTSNEALVGAGAVAVLGNLVSRDTEFSENSVLLFEGEGSIGETGGGAIIVTGEATISGGSFVDNFAAWGGGAIYAANSGEPLSISGVSLEGNTTLHAGGAIVAAGPTTISRSTFHENSSSSGGAIFALDELLSLDRTTFTDNVATGDIDLFFGECLGGGGAILSIGQVATSRSTFSGNRALIPAERALDDCLDTTGLVLLIGTGGAISSVDYVQSSGDRFAGNLAHLWGGAIVSFVGVGPGGPGSTRITGSTFDSNTAGSSTVAALESGLGSVGGAFVQIGGNLTIERSRFTRNQTGNAGGAIVYQGFGAESSLRLLRNTISGNRAGVPGLTSPDFPTYGGGLFLLLFTNGDPGQVEISRNTITNNSSGDLGGGAYILTQAIEGMQRNVIRGNSAVRGGGLALATCEARSRRVETTLRSTNQISRNRGSVDRDLMFDLESMYCLRPD